MKLLHENITQSNQLTTPYFAILRRETGAKANTISNLSKRIAGNIQFSSRDVQCMTPSLKR